MKRSMALIPTPQVKFELKKLGRVGGRVLVDYESSLRDKIEANKLDVDILPKESKIILFREDKDRYSIALYIKKTPGSFLRILLMELKTSNVDPFYETVKRLWETGEIHTVFDRFCRGSGTYRKGFGRSSNPL
jgi:isocitrate lyase